MESLVYKNLSSVGGPLPAFNLGVMIDTTKSSVGCVALGWWAMDSCRHGNAPAGAESCAFAAMTPHGYGAAADVPPRQHCFTHGSGANTDLCMRPGGRPLTDTACRRSMWHDWCLAQG